MLFDFWHCHFRIWVEMNSVFTEGALDHSSIADPFFLLLPLYINFQWNFIGRKKSFITIAAWPVVTECQYFEKMRPNLEIAVFECQTECIYSKVIATSKYYALLLCRLVQAKSEHMTILLLTGKIKWGVHVLKFHRAKLFSLSLRDYWLVFHAC